MSEPLTFSEIDRIDSTNATGCEESNIDQAFDALRTELSQIHALDPLTTDCMKLATQRLLSWVNNLDVRSPPFAEECAGKLGSTLSTTDLSRWRPTLAPEDTGDLFPQGDRSPISLLSEDSPAPQSSICDPESHQERTGELADSSVPSNHDVEHEQATLEAEPALKGQEATESLRRSSSNLEEDTQDSPNSTRSDDPRAETRDAPDAHLGDKGEERGDQTDRCEESFKKLTNDALKPASLVFTEDEQSVAQPHVQSERERSNEDDEGERIDGDEEDQEDRQEQTERVEEGAGAGRARRVGSNDDGKPEAPETHHMRPRSTQNEERPMEDARESRASSSVRLAGSANNAHDVSPAEELVSVQGIANPTETSAVQIYLNDVSSTSRLEMERGTETGQVISNDLVAIRADVTEEQIEHLGLTSDHRDAIEGAQSHQPGGVCDGDEIVVAHVLQRGPRSNGSFSHPRNKDTPDEGGHFNDSTDASDSSSDVEEDSDDIDLKANTSDHLRPRTKRASGANFSVPETPKKRRKTSPYLTEQTSCSAVNDIPNSMIQPSQVYQLIAGMLDKSREDSTTPLTSFFFAIGSPYAIRSFRDTCRQVRNVQASSPIPEESGAQRSSRALDHIDMHDNVSPILRRYHLVKLVERLSELQQQSSGALCQPEPKKLKYGLRRQPPPRALVGSKGAASKALERLMGEAYPEPLQGTGMKSARYNQVFKELKNRLSAGRNWHALQARFGIGILALLPVGKDVGVWNSNIEKVQHGVFAQILELLQERRGDALSKLSEAVSESIFDGLLGAPGAPSFVLEDEQNQLAEAPYDSPALVGKCSLRFV